MIRNLFRNTPFLLWEMAILLGAMVPSAHAQEKPSKTKPITGTKTSLKTEVVEAAPAGLIFVADGAGGKLNMSKNLKLVIDEERLPLQVVTFDWSHGSGRYLADHLFYDRAKREGLAMANVIQNFKQKSPNAPIYVVGHSAGVAVALTALESLPSPCVDKAFIISPSVSADYDIRPALKAVKGNLYVHYSSKDWFWMGVATRVAGSTDRRYGPTSGRVGFHVVADDPECKAKLVQRNWEPSDRHTGNNGGHFGGYESGYLRQQVIPWMLPQADKEGPATAARPGN